MEFHLSKAGKGKQTNRQVWGLQEPREGNLILTRGEART